ncbi:MAG: CIA30 family protein [Bacteroidota bacterium]
MPFVKGNLGDYIWIKDGRIHKIGKKAPKKFDGERRSLAGKFILPALWDMHVHSFGNIAPNNRFQMLTTSGTAKTMLYCGVGGFLDLFSEENYIIGLRDQQREEGLPGADIHCAGPIFTCTKGHGTEYGVPTRVVNTPEEARQSMAELAEKKPDVIKLVYDNAPNRMPTMDQATMEAVVAAANQHGIKVIAHIGTWQDVKEVVEAGGHAITHAPTDPLPEEVLQLMKEKQTTMIPTLSVQQDMSLYFQRPELLNSSLLQAVVDAPLLEAFVDSSKLEFRMKRFMAYQKATRKVAADIIQRMHKAGVPLLTGTDSGNPGVFQGYSVHREMALLHEFGLTPWEALAAATTRSAHFLGKNASLEEGALANLLILDASPLETLSHTEKIHAQVHHGKWVDRSVLLKAGIVAKAEKMEAPAWTQETITAFEEAKTDDWTAISDKSQGGNSVIRMKVAEEKAHIQGSLKPRQGGFGWAGLSHEFVGAGKPVDLSAYTGIKLRLKINKGSVYVSMQDMRVTNFDYHMSMLPRGTGEWQEVELPFDKFRQFFSDPISWDGKAVQGLMVGASGMAGDFDFEIDYIKLY